MNYKISEQLLDRALKSIPLASQTFSKSLTTYPRGVSPFFIEKVRAQKFGMWMGMNTLILLIL